MKTGNHSNSYMNLFSSSSSNEIAALNNSQKQEKTFPKPPVHNLLINCAYVFLFFLVLKTALLSTCRVTKTA